MSVEYQRRIADQELDTLMGDLPALALQGAHGVGKTATAAQRATPSSSSTTRDNTMCSSPIPR